MKTISILPAIKIVSTYKYLGSCLLLPVLIFCNFNAFNQHLEHLHYETTQELKMEAEKLWASVDKEKFRREIILEAKIPSNTANLFFRFMEHQWVKDKIIFFRNASRGEITQLNIEAYFSSLKENYMKEYTSFLIVKDQYERDLSGQNNKPMDASGACVNMDFEEGTFNGWTGETQDRGGGGGGGRNGGGNNNNTNPVPGFGQHCIMTPTQRDPFVPNLSVVAPGGTRSVRLGNTASGGHMARMSQSFRVDASNTIFTYRYAVVLETPADDNNHQGLNSPHFQAKLYDEGGNEISCGEYTVTVVGSNLSSYTHICVDARDNGADLNENIGCNNTSTVPASAVANPNSNNQCANNSLEIYYRDWTTVSISLTNYIGQIVRVEFIASDCEPSGHFGYAYVDAECTPLTLPLDQTICSGKETKTLTGPSGFNNYQWGPAGSFSGPGNTSSISIHQAGTFTLNVTTISDNPCIVALNYVVLDKCDPRAYTATLCETVKGSGQASGIDLNSYNSLVTENGTWGTVMSWHAQRPTSANRFTIANPGNATVDNGSILYAISSLPSRRDTIALTFTVNSLPDINFPGIAPLCVDGSDFQISDVTPTGGTFSGTHVNVSGLFSPVAVGTHSISYEYTNASSCTHRVTNSVLVQAKPTVDAGPPQLVCENASILSLRGTASNATGGLWTGGSGTYNPNELSASYTPNDADLANGSIVFTLTSIGSGVCPSATDQVTVTFEKMPDANAGMPEAVCETAPPVNLNGTITNASSATWIGGNGIFNPDRNSLNAQYTPHANEIAAGSVRLTLRTQGQLICPYIESTVSYTYEKTPTVNPGTGALLCESTSTIDLVGQATNAPGVSWSGGSGSFTNSNQLRTSYTVHPNDLSTGSVTFTLMSTGTVKCPAASGPITFTFERLPLVHAGTGSALCESNPTIHLVGTASNSPGIVWQGGTAGGYGSPTFLNTIYQPTLSEIESGSLTFILNSTGTQVCPAAQSPVTYTIEKMPQVNAGNDIAVCSNNISLSISGNVRNATGGIWTNGNGVFSPSVNDLTISYEPTPEEISLGLITLTLTTSGSVVCNAVSDQVQITITPSPTVNAGPNDTVCANTAQVILNGMSSTAGAVWSNGQGILSPNASTINAAYEASMQEITSGKATLILTSVNNGNCLAASDTMEIVIIPLPEVELGNTVVACLGDPVTLQVMNTPGMTYSWREDNNALSDILNSIQVGAKSGEVTYYVSVINQQSCVSSDSVQVVGVPTPQVSLKDTTICEGDPIVLNANPDNVANPLNNDPVYSWTKNSTVINNSNNSWISVTNSGLYSVVASIGNCSGSASAQVNIHPHPLPFLPELIKNCFETSKELELNAGPGISYAWLPSNESTQKIFVFHPGIYEVMVTNEYNCSITDQTEVKDVCPPRLFISNSFSPNGDFVNDQYHVYGAHIANFRMLIFNRWGEVIFESTDRGIVWDGKYKGEPMVDGVYPWTITYEGDSEEYKGPYAMNGSVTLVR